GSAGGEELLSHLTVSRTNFDPAMLIVARERHGGMRRNADGARNFFAPMEIGEKVLAEALACHGCNSVTTARGWGIGKVRETERRVPEWELLLHTPAVFVRVANNRLTGYGTW